MKIFDLIYGKVFGNLKLAKKQGMTVEPGVSVMKGANFGSEPYLITLRRNCRISSDVVFVTHDGGTYAFRHLEKYKAVIKFGKIVVGEGSFIGTRSITMPNVKIGSHCVIGAGSVVTKDVPDGMVVCGNPARVICSVEDYAEKCLERMPSNFDKESYMHDKKKWLLNHII